MTIWDYRSAQELVGKGYSFRALITAALMRADDNNVDKIRRAWPDIASEAAARYSVAGGLLPGEAEPMSPV